jgi:hypothetical protein
MTSTKPIPGPLTTPTHTPGEPVSGVRPITTREEREAALAAEAREAALEAEARASGTAGLSSVSRSHAAGASAGEPVASSTAGGEQPVNLVDLARQVEAGQLTMGQAVERLVEGTIGSLPRQLTDLERAELTNLLRSAVSSDPSLSALQDDSA